LRLERSRLLKASASRFDLEERRGVDGKSGSMVPIVTYLPPSIERSANPGPPSRFPCPAENMGHRQVFRRGRMSMCRAAARQLGCGQVPCTRRFGGIVAS